MKLDDLPVQEPGGNGGYEVKVVGNPQVQVTARPDGGIDWKVSVDVELSYYFPPDIAEEYKKMIAKTSLKRTFKFAGGTIGPCANNDKKTDIPHGAGRPSDPIFK